DRMLEAPSLGGHFGELPGFLDPLKLSSGASWRIEMELAEEVEHRAGAVEPPALRIGTAVNVSMEIELVAGLQREFDKGEAGSWRRFEFGE
ncbi:MAG: hypothetical protein ACQKBU_00650, partial [Verrucomicrobiales bacterium]